MRDREHVLKCGEWGAQLVKMVNAYNEARAAAGKAPVVFVLLVWPNDESGAESVGSSSNAQQLSGLAKVLQFVADQWSKGRSPAPRSS